MSKQIQAGKAVVAVEANRSKLAKGLAAAQSQLKAFASGAAKIGAGAIASAASFHAPIGVAMKAFANAGSEMDYMSKRVGTSVEALSELEYVARSTGGGIEDIESSLMSVQSGLASGSDAFGRIGLSIAKLRGMKPEEQFSAIADAIAAVPDPAKRSAAAMSIFGGSGAKLLPVLNGGAEAIEQLKSKAQNLGVVMTGEQATAAAKLSSAMDDTAISMRALMTTISAQLAPSFTVMFRIISKVIDGFRDWVNSNKEMILRVSVGATILTALGAALISASGAAIGLSFAMGVVATAAGTVISVISSLNVIKMASAASSAISTAAAIAWANATKVLTAVQLACATVLKAHRLIILGWGAAVAAVRLVQTGWIVTTKAVTAAMAVLRGITLSSIASMAALALITPIVTTAKGALAVASMVVTGAMGAMTAAATVLQAVLTGGIAVAIAALIVGLAGLAGYFVYSSGVGGKAIDWLGKKFQMLSEIVGPVFQGIQDSMLSGNFALAAEILWNGVQLAWAKGTDELWAMWDSSANSILDVYDSVLTTMLNSFDSMLNRMLGLLDSWIATFRSKWNDVSGWIADRMLDVYGQIDSSFDAEQAKQIRREDTERQNKGFARGVEERAAARDASAKSNAEDRAAKNIQRAADREKAASDNVVARAKRIAELEAALAGSVAQATVAAAATDALDKSQFEGTTDASGVRTDQGPLGTYSGFAAALMGAASGTDVQSKMLSENEKQTSLLAQQLEIAKVKTKTSLDGLGVESVSRSIARSPSGNNAIDKIVSAINAQNPILVRAALACERLEGTFS